MSGATDLSIRSLPYLDAKWLRADLYGALQNTEDLAVLWNNLIKDNELVTSCSGVGGGTTTLVSGVTVNSSGHVSYIGNNGRHYCGQKKLLCSCCTGFCRPMSECNCSACHQLDMEEPTKKNSSGSHQSLPPSDSILDSWLWGPIPSMCTNLYHFFFFNKKINLIFCFDLYSSGRKGDLHKVSAIRTTRFIPPGGRPFTIRRPFKTASLHIPALFYCPGTL